MTYMKLIKFLFLIPVLALSWACKKEEKTTPTSTTYQYLYLGHIYKNSTTIDPRIEDAHRFIYKQIWLGGDVCSETTQDESTLDYLDTIFNLKSPNTHWSVGNHDIRNGNESWITSRTQRETFYATHFNGITLLVLNTNFRWPDDCAPMENQLNLIQSVCDTISESSHLVVLTHHVVWGTIDNSATLLDIGNTEASWIPFSCSTSLNTTFENIILPELIEVQARGTSVICIAGDLGQKVNSYEYKTEDGIVFLGSGITSETPWNQQFQTAGEVDKVLRFYHNITKQELFWEFINVDDI